LRGSYPGIASAFIGETISAVAMPARGSRVAHSRKPTAPAAARSKIDKGCNNRRNARPAPRSKLASANGKPQTKTFQVVGSGKGFVGLEVAMYKPSSLTFAAHPQRLTPVFESKSSRRAADGCKRLLDGRFRTALPILLDLMGKVVQVLQHEVQKLDDVSRVAAIRLRLTWVRMR
jgi:hypothetical protein